jgi:serine/threonine protein kinase
MSYVVTLPKPGDRLGPDYRIDRQLDNDGVTAVFGATAPATGARYMLRCFLSHDAADWAAATEQFMRRARRANLFQERKIVEVLFVHEDRGRFFAVTEWLEGLTLDRYIQQHGAMACERALQLLTPCAQALATAHRAGIVHGAVHARNIFVCSAIGSEPEHARVQNFGYGNLFARAEFAKQREQRDAEPRATVPEAAPDERSALAADLHGFGVMLYQVLAGPSSSDKDSGAAAARSTLAQRGQHIPPALVDIIARALAVQPTERYASFDDMAKDLAKQLQTRSTPSAKRRKGSLHATLRWTPAVPIDVTARASIPLGATAPGGWYPDASPSPDQNVSLRDREAEYGGAVARSSQSASVMRAPMAALPAPAQRGVDAARPYTWITPASEIEAIEWLPTDSGLESERPHAAASQSRYWLLPRWVGHVGVCVSLLAGVAVAIELVARARSESAERPTSAMQPGRDSTAHTRQGQVGLAPATLTAIPPVVLNQPPSAAGVKPVTGAASAAERVESKLTQANALHVLPTASSPAAAAEPPPSAASARVAATQSSSAERVASGASADSLRHTPALPSPAATPAAAPRNAPQPASPSPPAATTNPASAPSGGKVGLEVGSQPKTLDAMKLL